MAAVLGREKILYDKWYAAEFARLGLGFYLPDLYHNESDLLVVCLCEEYDKKEWCGLEWRAIFDLIKRREYERVMLLRLDQVDIAKIPGFFSIDGYLDIRQMPEADVAAAIRSRLGLDGPGGPSYRAFTSKLPAVNTNLVGRETELGFLERAWADPVTKIVQVIAAGGTGKTALVDKWFRRHLSEATVFGWSFYSQGSSADRQTSSDPFFTDIIKWLDIDVAPTDSIDIKAEAIARRLRQERVLLILDGVEPIQEADGTLRDSALKALLQELATENQGLVVCTTRVRIDVPEAVPLDLKQPHAGAGSGISAQSPRGGQGR